jgi:hypothetical protein
MPRPNFAAFGHGSRADQHVFRYVLEYVAAEHAVFPPYKCVSCRSLVRWLLIFNRGKQNGAAAVL